MKLKSLIVAALMVIVSLVSCSVEDNPSNNENPVMPSEVKLTEVSNLTPSFIAAISGVEVGQELKPGSTVTLTLTPAEILWEGFADYHMQHIHVHVGDKVYIPEFPAGGEMHVQEVKLDITVPDTDFGIVVAYAIQQHLKDDGYMLRLEDNVDGVQLFGVSQELKYDYFDCYLRTPEAYTIDQVEYKIGDGEWIVIDDFTLGCSVSRSYEVDDVYELQIYPKYEEVTGDVTIRVSGTQHKRSKITWKNLDFFNQILPEGWEPIVLPEKAIGGERVTVQFYAKVDYYLAGATANVEGVEVSCIDHYYIQFIMPEEDVEITLNFKEKVPVSYEASANIMMGELYDDNDIYYGVPATKATPGEYVYLFVRASQGYKPSKAINDRGEQFNFVTYGDGNDQYSHYAEVRVPEDATQMTVRAEAVVAYTVSGSNIYFGGGNIFAPGETVQFIVSVPSGQQIDQVTAHDTNGANVAVTMDGTHGSFVMPNANVTVEATFKELDPSQNVTIKAFYDDEEYSVYSQTSPYYGRLTSEGIMVNSELVSSIPAGQTLYISVSDDYGMPFWVGMKIGSDVQYYQAQEDEDSGEFTFGRSITCTGNTEIKVGSSKSSVTF